MTKVTISYYRTYHLTGMPDKPSLVKEYNNILDCMKELHSLITSDAYYIEIVDEDGFNKVINNIQMLKYKDGKWHIDKMQQDM